MEQTIQINVREIYGVRKAYPLCKDAMLFAEIAGTKTLTRNTLRRIKDLGYVIKISYTDGFLDLDLDLDIESVE